MRGALQKIKDKFLGRDEFSDDFSDEYLEIDTEKTQQKKAKVLVRPFIVNDFEDIKPAVDALREGYTITLINIKPIKDRDIVELKRAVNKLKKICDAIDGDIAGFGEDWIVVTPSFAKVHRSGNTEEVTKE